MKIDSTLIYIGGGILVLLGLIYLLRQRLLFYAVNRGITFIQRFVFQTMITFSEEEPTWVLAEYPSSKRYTLGILTQSNKDRGTIFIPSGPKLIPGQMIFLDRKYWHPINVDFDEGLKLMITMGLIPETETVSKEIWERMEEF